MIVNRFRAAINAFKNPDNNLFNEAVYKFLGSQTITYNPTLEVLMTKGYGQNPDVNAIVNQMCTKSIAVPFIIKPIDNEKAFKKYKRFPNNPTFLQTKAINKLKAEAFKDEEQPMPIDKPNPNQSWLDLIYLYKLYLKVCGNVYIYKLAPENGANAGVPLQLYILPSHWMQIVLKSKNELSDSENPIDYYVMEQGNQLVKFSVDSIIHIKRPNPFYNQSGSHLYGYSELMAAIRNINSSNSGIDNNLKTMQNSGVYGFIHAGDGQNPLTAEQATSLKDRLVEMDNNKGRLSNIAGASAKLGFTKLSLTTNELQPFAFLANDRRTLCNCLNWPIDLLNEERSGTGFGVDGVIEARKRAVTDNIKPDLDLLAEYLNLEFIQKHKGYEKSVLEFDISELPEMQTDTSKLIEWMTKAPLTLNEIREAVNYQRIEDENMDVIYINSTSKRIDDPSVNEMVNGQT